MLLQLRRWLGVAPLLLDAFGTGDGFEFGREEDVGFEDLLADTVDVCLEGIEVAVKAFVLDFFLMRVQVLRFQLRISSSLRSRAFPTGRCGLHSSARRIFQTWPSW